MNAVAEFALGLGIFFVGMQMIGEHLRQLSGPSFRALVARSTSSRASGAALGLAAGAMMQSATGVTFVLVNMVAGGLIAPGAALPVIAWSNVGLTALAFVVSLDIHPFVAASVGLCGLVATLVRTRIIRQVASVLLGMALILFGLETMSAAAGPLGEAAWLQSAIERTVALPPLAFLVGFLLAAVLQSNTGATMLVITLAARGMLGLPAAAMLIYGTNLGAIVLRVMLTFGTQGVTRQLVRFEDLFCLASGALMVTLFVVERVLGVPLVLAAVSRVSANVAVQLALVFFLSNLLPALAVMPVLDRCRDWLARLWPAGEDTNAAEPRYLTPQSLQDPASAVDLIPRELARLLASLKRSVQAHREDTDTSDVEDRRAADYAMLTRRIDDYAAQLAVLPLQRPVTERLNLMRELTSVVGYLAEAYVTLRQSHRALRGFAGTEGVRDQILSALEALLGAAAEAVDKRDPSAISRLRQQSRSHSELIEQARESCVRGAVSDGVSEREVAQRTATLKLLTDFELITWILHRLSKLLEQLGPREDAARGMAKASSAPRSP